MGNAQYNFRDFVQIQQDHPERYITPVFGFDRTPRPCAMHHEMPRLKSTAAQKAGSGAERYLNAAMNTGSKQARNVRSRPVPHLLRSLNRDSLNSKAYWAAAQLIAAPADFSSLLRTVLSDCKRIHSSEMDSFADCGYNTSAPLIQLP